METITSNPPVETEKTLNEKILVSTMLIREKYPELYGFLGETPASPPDDNNPDVTIKALTDYLESLDTMIKKYAVEHPLK